MCPATEIPSALQLQLSVVAAHAVAYHGEGQQSGQFAGILFSRHGLGPCDTLLSHDPLTTTDNDAVYVSVSSTC